MFCTMTFGSQKFGKDSCIEMLKESCLMLMSYVISLFWERILYGKSERGSNIIFSIIFRLMGRISSGEKGKGDGKFWGRKSRTNKKKMGMGKNNNVQVNFKNPWVEVWLSLWIQIISKRQKQWCIFP